MEIIKERRKPGPPKGYNHTAATRLKMHNAAVERAEAARIGRAVRAAMAQDEKKTR
jgi:hypothetical protein